MADTNESQAVPEPTDYENSPSKKPFSYDDHSSLCDLPSGFDDCPTSGSSSPKLLLSDNNESSEHLPSLDGSIITSTPYSSKFIAGLKSDDNPFSTPSNTESSDRSLTTPSTGAQSASSMEIFLGPQPLPFIRNRNRYVLEDFAPSPSRSKAHSSSDSIPVKTPSPHPKVSTWRLEQLKKDKTVQAVPGACERPIPLLHGPLSLPYARNPSGVDATVADHSSYLSNVYGLRMVASPEKDPRRTVSDSRGVVSSASNNMAAASNQSNLPAVVRDYNQVIGIKKDESGPLQVNSRVANLRGLGIGRPVTSTTAPPTHDDAIHSASGVLWRTHAHTEPLPEFKTLTLIDPTTNQLYNVRVPKSESMERPMYVEMLAPKYPNSKADTSANWRTKTQHFPARAPPPPFNSPLPIGPNNPDRAILTVDHLYEKYGPQKQLFDYSPAPVQSPKSPEPTTMFSDSTRRQVIVQVLTPTTAATTSDKKKRIKSRKESTRLRGTPGAGKHLKRTVSDDGDKPEKVATPTHKSRAKASSPTPSRSKPSAKA